MLIGGHFGDIERETNISLNLILINLKLAASEYKFTTSTSTYVDANIFSPAVLTSQILEYRKLRATQSNEPSLCCFLYHLISFEHDNNLITFQIKFLVHHYCQNWGIPQHTRNKENIIFQPT
jgi:hypothetical protein